jgi:uncharacterized protein YbjT (DUF2867 family)
VEDRHVLVTGANGFIASRLIPRLLQAGYHVRVMARRPELLEGRAWLPQVDVVRGSTADEAGMRAAMAGIHSAFYLIHNMSSGRGYTHIEQESAGRFAAAAEAAHIQHILYLGGLANPADPHIAPHMRSRIETGEILRHGRVPVTEFRAGVIAGAGSISFEMIRFLTECFPILPGPSWLRNKAQPIASENVIDYLLAGLENSKARGGIYEMGGLEQMTYAETMLRYARARHLRRWLFTLPGIPIWWMAMFVDRLTPVPYPIATALVGGLQSDSVVTDEAARQVFPEVQLTRYDDALRETLKDLVPARLERVWEGLSQDTANFRHEGFIVDHRRRTVAASASKVFEQLMQMGGQNPWPYADWLWRLRGFIDRLIPGSKLESKGIRGGQAGREIGDTIDYYRVEALEPGRLLRLRSTLRAPGEGWMEWRVEPLPDGTSLLSQTAFFAPVGFGGFLYWFGLGPIHRLVFRGLIDAIKKKSESS